MGYKEINARYRQQIMVGALKPGDKVPAIRVLAEELKVARKTVEASYTNIRSEQQAMTLLQRVQQPRLALLKQAN